MFYFLEFNQIITSFVGCILIALLLGTIGTMVIYNKLIIKFQRFYLQLYLQF